MDIGSPCVVFRHPAYRPEAGQIIGSDHGNAGFRLLHVCVTGSNEVVKIGVYRGEPRDEWLPPPSVLLRDDGNQTVMSLSEFADWRRRQEIELEHMLAVHGQPNRVELLINRGVPPDRAHRLVAVNGRAPVEPLRTIAEIRTMPAESDGSSVSNSPAVDDQERPV